MEIAGLGPAPHCGMMLADLGAEVILVERMSVNPNASKAEARASVDSAFYKRGKKSIALDLKKPESIEVVLRLIEKSDVLIEGFRPGVMERLGLGPDVCHTHNPRLIYGRMTGWGQTGPLAHAAGHDINYIAIAGALYYTGHEGETPFTPPTVVGDVGGGAMTLALGILAALIHVRESGEGQVIDAAVTDGTAYMMTLLASTRCPGLLSEPRDTSTFSGGAPWYQAYECMDGNYVTVGSLEPGFYRLLLEKCGLQSDPDFVRQFDTESWPHARIKMERLFKTRSRDQWCELLEGTDVCFGPVLSLPEAQQHPQNIARGNFVEINGHTQPSPAPKFSKTATQAGSICKSGAHTRQILRELGYSEEQLLVLSAQPFRE